MRRAVNPQPDLGPGGIKNIDLDLKSRGDIPALLIGLQHLYSDEDFRERLFALIEEHSAPALGVLLSAPCPADTGDGIGSRVHH